jgi:hypothetical protein
MDKIVAEAVKALKINVPILRVHVDGDQVTLWLYGHTEPVNWRRTSAKPKRTAKRTTTRPTKT